MELKRVFGNETFVLEPVEIESSDGETVTFTLMQTLSETGVAWMATVYDAVGNPGVCDRKDDAEWGTFDSYTADCVDGYASVNLYFHGKDIAGVAEDNISLACGQEYVETGSTVLFLATVPCDERCGEVESPPPKIPGEPTSVPSSNSPTAAPSEQPSQIPSRKPATSIPSTVPSAEPSMAIPTTRRFPAPPKPNDECVEICIEGDDYSRNLCQSFTASSAGEDAVGEVCIEVESEGGHSYLNVSFSASVNWTFVSVEFWIGENATEVPMDDDNQLDLDSFPYYWCNSSGASWWTDMLALKWEYLCEQERNFSLSMIAQATIGQLNEDGTLIEDSELTVFATEYDAGFYSWFDFDVICECPEPCVENNNTTPNISVTTDICIETDEGLDTVCYDILEGGSSVVGSVCTRLGDEDGEDVLQLNFVAEAGWTFLTTEVWVGENVSQAPLDEDGTLDTDSFPVYWCNSTGAQVWNTTISMKWLYECDVRDSFLIALISQVTVAKLQDDGSVDHETEVTAFAYEYQDANGLYAWYEVNVLCDCEANITGNQTATEICIDSVDQTMQDCFQVFANDTFAAGSMCLEIVNKTSLQISFSASEGWTFLSAE